LGLERCRHLVEESVDGDDLALVGEHRDIGADDRRVDAFRAELPGEARLVVVPVDGPASRNVQPGNCCWAPAIVSAIASLPSAPTSGSM